MNGSSSPTKIEMEGMEFHIHPFRAYEALRLKTTFLKKLLPAFGELVGSAAGEIETKNVEDINIDGKSFSSAIKTLFENLSESEFESLVKRFICKTQVVYNDGEGQKAGELSSENVFDAVFSRRLSLLYKLIFEIIKVNYPDFFELMGGIGNRLKTAIGGLQTIDPKRSTKG